MQHPTPALTARIAADELPQGMARDFLSLIAQLELATEAMRPIAGELRLIASWRNGLEIRILRGRWDALVAEVLPRAAFDGEGAPTEWAISFAGAEDDDGAWHAGAQHTIAAALARWLAEEHLDAAMNAAAAREEAAEWERICDAATRA